MEEKYTYVTADIIKKINVGFYLKTKDVDFIKAYNKKAITTPAENKKYKKIIYKAWAKVGHPITGLFEENGNPLFKI